MKSNDWDRIAREYHKYVISPFQKGVSNPLFGKLKKVKNSNKKVIADIGCGRGDTLNFLSSNFKQVYALDFSREMIEIAKERTLQTKKNNVFYSVQDMRDLSKFQNKFDVVISVNSIIMPRILDVKKSLSSIHNSLNNGGEFYAIFPSMDSILYEGFLIFEQKLEKMKNEKKALKAARRALERNKYDFIKGTYNDSGEEQKFYYEFEIVLRLKEAGFREISIQKVRYPWGDCTGDFLDFPGKPKLWDWFVSAKK